MTCQGHGDSVPGETVDDSNGAHTCRCGPFDGNYAPFHVAPDPDSRPVPGTVRSDFDVFWCKDL